MNTGREEIEKKSIDIKKKFEVITSKEKFTVPSEGIHQAVIPVLGILILLSIKILSDLISNQAKYPIGSTIALVACVLSAVCVSLASFHFYSKQLIQSTCKKLMDAVQTEKNSLDDAIRQSNKDSFESLNKKCQECVQTLAGNVINAYSLYTYKQLLKIEESVGQESGDNRCVFCYSTYRDDGDEVGVEEAEKVISANQEKGVKYYNIYYKEPGGLQPNQNFVNEVFINLSETEELRNGLAEACLDYKFFRQVRFDIMIYQWDPKRVEGYFCINFPLRANCLNYNNCPYSCNAQGEERTEKVFYKKMSPIITNDLLRRLRDVAQKEGKL